MGGGLEGKRSDCRLHKALDKEADGGWRSKLDGVEGPKKGEGERNGLSGHWPGQWAAQKRVHQIGL